MFTPRIQRSQAQEAAEDIFFGQIAIIWARWFVIAAGAIMALWSAQSVSQLTVSILIVVALMAVNFFTHGRYLVERPANQFLLMATSMLDVVIITLVVAIWPGSAGLNNHFFVLYYPLLFAFALVFPPVETVAFSILALGLYAGVCLIADPVGLLTISGFEILTTRLLTLGAMGGLGTFYYRRQRAALRAANPSPIRVP